MITSHNFQTFVLGTGNELAFKAVRTIIDAASPVYNPLFIYGGSGTGKTHLLEAIRNELRETRPNAVVRYVTTERFVNTVKTKLAETQIPGFFKGIEKIDVLLMDDVQFLESLPRRVFHGYFLHTFDTLLRLSKQMVFAVNKNPRELQGFAEPLQQRFSSGLAVELQQPDKELKVQMVMERASAHGLTIERDVAHYIATHSDGSMWALEGVLTTFVAQCQLTGTNPNLATATKLMQAREVAIDFGTVEHVICQQFRISQKELHTKSNAVSIVHPRQVAMYLCARVCNESKSAIARWFGKDHSTVLHAIEKIEKQRTKDSELDSTLNVLMKALLNFS